MEFIYVYTMICDVKCNRIVKFMSLVKNWGSFYLAFPWKWSLVQKLGIQSTAKALKKISDAPCGFWEAFRCFLHCRRPLQILLAAPKALKKLLDTFCGLEKALKSILQHSGFCRCFKLRRIPSPDAFCGARSLDDSWNLSVILFTAFKALKKLLATFCGL